MRNMRAPVRSAVCSAAVTIALALAGAPMACAQDAAGAGAKGAGAQPVSATYKPITGVERLKWVAESTLGPQHLVGGMVQAGFNTGLDLPREDGPHWGGFGERYGQHVSVVTTSNTMEAGLGAFWGEDPRYRRVPERSLKGRLGSVVVQAFVTRRRDGHFAPAYARYMAIPGSNFLANTWWPNSEADSYHAGLRTLYGFAGQIGNNAWDEFWPSISERIFHRR